MDTEIILKSACLVNDKDLVDLFSAFGPTIAAVIAVIVAFCQYRSNERQRKQDLFEKRYNNLYLKILECFNDISKIGEEEISNNEKNKKIEETVEKFWNSFNKYKFLVSEEDDKKLTSYYENIIKIIKTHDNIDTNKVENLIDPLVNLFSSFSDMENILSKYLRVESNSFKYTIKKKLCKKYSIKDIVELMFNSFDNKKDKKDDK